jgi:uncharacterized membrane protein
MPTNHATLAITEENHYARHVFTSAVGWFTLFITVNYISVGWISNNTTGWWQSIALISFLFMLQNLIAIFALEHVREYFKEPNTRMAKAHAVLCAHLGDENHSDYYPKYLYYKMVRSMIGALIILFLTWFVIFIFAVFCPNFSRTDITKNKAEQDASGNRR